MSEPTPIASRFSSLPQRIATAIIYAAALVAGVWFGALALSLVLAALAGFAAWEFYRIMRREQRLPNELLGVAAAVAMPIYAATWGLTGTAWVLTALLALLVPWSVFYARVRTADVAVTVFGSVYTGFLLSYLVLVREMRSGLVLALAFIVSIWASDVLAYFAGSAFGRHKLAPRISPKKSWEGLVGGTLGAVAVWAVVPYVPGADIELWLALVTGLGVALTGLLGDLFESRIKREAGVKDSGTLLPGHGGFLDRIDSMLFAAFAVYWILKLGGLS